MRRQHKSMEMSRMKPKSNTQNMSDASKRALATRFIKEFDTAILDFLEVGKEPKLDYIQINELLKKLSFLKDSETVDAPHFTPERILLYDMWYSLYGDKYKGVHRRNLLVFLLAVLGLHYQITKITKNNTKNANQMVREDDDEDGIRHQESMSNIQSEEEDKNAFDPSTLQSNPEIGQRQRRIVGTFDNAGNNEFTPEEVKKIQKIYDVWYLNRLRSYDNVGHMISSRKFEDHSYHPEILESSKQMAQSYREKILEETAELIQKNKITAPKDGKLTHADLLVLTKKIVKEKVQQQGEAIRDEQFKDCTFQPQTNDGQSSKILGKDKTHRNGSQVREEDNLDETTRKLSASIGKNKALELYALAKSRNNKKDRNTLEIDYEKNCDECTFTPDITTTRNIKPSTGPADIYAKNIDKTIERIRTARVEREELNIYKERGFSTGGERHFQFSIDNFKKNKGSAMDGENIPQSTATKKSGLNKSTVSNSISRADKTGNGTTDSRDIIGYENDHANLNQENFKKAFNGN